MEKRRQAHGQEPRACRNGGAEGGGPDTNLEVAVHNVEAVQVLRCLQDGLDELARVLLRVAALGDDAVKELTTRGTGGENEYGSAGPQSGTRAHAHVPGPSAMTYRSITKYSLSSVSNASTMEMMLGCLTRRRISTSVSIISSLPSTSFLSMILSAYSLPVSRSLHFFTMEKLPLQGDPKGWEGRRKKRECA